MKKFCVIFLFLLCVVNLAQTNDVSITVNGYKLNGTLVVPASDKPVSVAVIIAGSGPTDRDGNNRLIQGKGDTYKMISELLYKNGIASLRYDKRGIGVNEKVNESNLTFEMYINDAVEWINYLKKDKRFAQIIIIGHSEGSLIGMIASKQAGADKYVSLCGAGKSADKIIDEQIGKQPLPDDLKKQYQTIMDSLRSGNEVKNVNQNLITLFRPSVQKYLISWFKYDPCKEISKLIIPVLVVGGTTDIQVSTEDAELLAKSNPNCKKAIIENLNHVLKDVKTKDLQENFRTYGDSSLSLSAELCKGIIEFIK